MTRTKGSRNTTYEQKRSEMLDRIMLRLAERDAGGASLRELAVAAGVSFATIRHYFGDRDGVIAALMTAKHEQGRPYLSQMSSTEAPFAQSVKEAVAFVLVGLEAGLGELHSVGLAEGLQHSRLGTSYTNEIFDPTIDALARRLTQHMERGEMREADPRHAALILLSPVILAGLHQYNLGGSQSLPLDVKAFIEDHAEAFIRAWHSNQSHS